MANVFRAVVGLAVGALLNAPVVAQPSAQGAADQATPQPDNGQAPDEIIVRGRRMSEIKSDLRIHVDDFLQQVTAPPAGRGYARWHRRVCISITNLEQKTAQYLVDRISHLAVDVGLTPGEPGCRPDVMIIFTTDGKEMAANLLENEPTLLRPYGDGGVQLGVEALHEFVESDKPVRWWHVSLPVDAQLGVPAIRLPGEPLDAGATKGIKVNGPSHIHSGIVDELVHVVVIVDGPKLQGRGTTWQQLGDYLALVSLAQIDFRTEPKEFDSILNLFDNPAAYSGLTDWDLTFIRSLYSYDQERTPPLQRNEIVNRMVTREIYGTD
jgi:hypothetical protein